MTITFPATLHRLSMDREGEVSLTLKVPATSLQEVVTMSVLNDQVFRVEVRPEKEES